MKRIGLIGAGNIGSELYHRIKNKSWEVSFILKRDGVHKDVSKELSEMVRVDEKHRYSSYLDKTDAICLAIPSDDGKIAFDYIMSTGNIPVVTCEKGALSNFFPELKKELPRMGYSATVGGGTRILNYLEERFNPNVTEVHAIVNGTLNFVFDEVSKGKSLEKVIKKAKKLGYAEPGAENSLDVINGEGGDVVMKSVILSNLCFNNFYARAKDVETRQISNDELEGLIKEADNWRYIVSITKAGKKEEIVGGFEYGAGKWLVSAGFKNIKKIKLYSELVVSGVNNALLICEGKHGRDGIYKITGPGAGPAPTASSMLIDLEKLLKC